MYSVQERPMISLLHFASIRMVRCCFIVYSITDRKTFKTIDKLLDDMRTKTDRDTNVFLVGNKIGLAEEVVVHKERTRKSHSPSGQNNLKKEQKNIGIIELLIASPKQTSRKDLW